MQSQVAAKTSNLKAKAEKTFTRKVYKYIRDANNSRRVETAVAMRFLEGCNSILDVGCGTGNFLERAPERIVGVDYNPDCVNVCLFKGLNARQGNALDLPFEDNTFDGVYSAHVMHVFASADALQYMKELVRVVKPRGVIGVCTIPDTKRTWIHAENARPYPPLAIRGMFRTASFETETAPTLRGLPSDVYQEAIWFRRSALFDFLGHSSHTASGIGSLLNGIQIRCLLRKYWTFDGYIIKLRNSAKLE
jgi:ubiquinone/menaquinone biosynthesis C-methylase UbiE